MLEIHKEIVRDENENPVAVQIPIEEFDRIEERFENYGLAKLMDEVQEEERLSLVDAKQFYQALKQNVAK